MATSGRDGESVNLSSAGRGDDTPRGLHDLGTPWTESNRLLLRIVRVLSWPMAI